jgi:hypothetical protein
VPGGRLTAQDRRHIAAGLSAGLGYAEIARGLGRPTSTVSREVARNGGPHGYGAAAAHEATAERARRGGRSAVTGAAGAVLRAEPPAEPDGGRDPAAVREFTESFASMMTDTGLPRMAARVLARLFTTDTAGLTATDLVRRLAVSPASVSKAVCYLERLEVVRREREPGGRRERYVVDDDVWMRAWLSGARTTVRWADTARRGARLLGPRTTAGARLEQMGRFFTALGDDMAGGPAAEPVEDALTVLAALLHAGAPLTAEQLARALRDAVAHPEAAGPAALLRTRQGAYTVTAAPGRLSDHQRLALLSAGPVV